MKRLLTLTFLGLFALSLSAQNVFWSETFDSEAEFQANWTTGGTNAGPEDWTWTDDPTGTFNGQADFAGTTAATGFIEFNSDSNGNFAHDVTLTSSAIDCSGQSSVVLRSENQYAFYSTDGSSIPEVGVSTNGTDFTYYEVLMEVAQNELGDPVQVIQLELPEAANQPTVYIQFRWRGFYEYYWRIDDVSLQDGIFVINNDVAFAEVLVAPNFSTPVSQIDTVRFQASVTNNGVNPQTNIMGTVEIIGDNGDSFTATQMIAELAPGATDTLEYDEFFVPSGLGNYIMTYSIVQDSTDEVPLDNTVETAFIISEDLFTKDDADLENATQPGDIASGQTFQIGNLFTVYNEGYVAREAIFSVASDANIHQDQSVSVFLYRIEDSGDEEFNDDDVIVVAFATHEFTDEENFELISIPMVNAFDFTDSIPLTPGDYLMMVEYTGDMFCPYSGLTYSYNSIASVVRDENNDWFLGGFGDDVTAIIRLRIGETVTSTRDLPELVNAKLKVYPNPMQEQATVEIGLEQSAQQVQLSLLNLHGQVLQTQQFDNVQDIRTQLDVSDLPIGTYVLRLLTEQGFKASRLVIQR